MNEVIEWCYDKKPYKSQAILKYLYGSSHSIPSPAGDCLVIKQPDNQFMWIFLNTDEFFTVITNRESYSAIGDHVIGGLPTAKNLIEQCNQADIAEGLLINHPIALIIRSLKWI